MYEVASGGEKRKAYQREYRRKNQQILWEKHGKKWGEWRSFKRKFIRMEVFDHYGNKCVCCGESQHEFLTIDHINGGGNIERKKLGIYGGTHFYAFLKRAGYSFGVPVAVLQLQLC